MKTRLNSSLFMSKKAKITVDFKKEINICSLSNTDIWILISLPNGLRGGKDITRDENYLEAVLEMLEKYNRNLQENHLNGLGKIYILIAGGITRHDFFLKFPEHIDVKLQEVYEKLPHKNPTEIELAEDLAELLGDEALAIEHHYINKYKKHLDNKQICPNLNYEVIGWAQLLDTLGDSYLAVKDEIIQQYKEDIFFQKHFNDAANDFLDKKQTSIEKLKIKFQELCPEIKIDFNLYGVQACLLYLLAEAAFFRLVKGKLLYPSPIMEELFNIILKQNPQAEFLQIVYESWVEKPLTGYSSSFILHKEFKPEILLDKERKKPAQIKSSLTTTPKEFKEPLTPRSAEVSKAVENWWRFSSSRDKKFLFDLVKISAVKAQTSQVDVVQPLILKSPICTR